MERDLTPAQVRDRLVLAARRIRADHAPVGGRCPVCRVADCEAAEVAATYLRGRS